MIYEFSATNTTAQEPGLEASSPSSSAAPVGGQRILYWAAVILLCAVSIGGSLHWINRNVVLIGRDAGGHLIDTLEQAEILREPSLQSLLMALSFNSYRPPAFFLFSQPFYALLGYSADAAQLQNVLWLAVILGLTFVYGWRFQNAFVALLALALTAFLPMLAGMTRMFYTENFITAMVMLNLLALMESKRFSRRGWSLIWGVSAALGLLVKWTFPVYVFIPLLLVIWPPLRRPQVQQSPPEQANGSQRWRTGGISLAVGAALTALLVIFSYAYIATLVLGPTIFLVWFMLIAATAFMLQQRSSPWNNLLGAIMLALLLASVWYLTRIEFVTDLFDAAFGTYGGRRSHGFDPLDSRFYTRNWVYLWRMHLGPLFAVLLLPALIGWGKDLLRWRTLALATQLLWGSVASAFLFLTFVAQGNERNLAPLLPILALLAATALLHFSRPWRIGLASIWVLCLFVQWSTLTFDELAPLAEASAPLWVEGEYAVRPASGATDPGFWIAPDVLARVAAAAPDGFPASLGILVNSSEIHRGPFRYLVSTQGLPVEVRTLGEIDMNGIGEVFANQWVLIKNGDNRDVEGPGRAAIARILDGDTLFAELYAEDTHYPLPNGETAWLYRRIGENGHPYTDQQMLASGHVVVDHLNRWWSKGSTLVIPNVEVATWIGIAGLGDVLRDANIVIADQMEAPAKSDAGQDAGPIFVVLGRDSAALEASLGAMAVKALAVGDENLSLAVYGRPQAAPQTLPVAEARNGTTIERIQTQPEVTAGEVLVLDLAMQGDLRESRRISLRIVDPAGANMAQNDQVVAESVTAGLFIPPDTTPGTYSLAAVMYDLPDMAPLTDGDKSPEIELMEIEVLPPPG